MICSYLYHKVTGKKPLPLPFTSVRKYWNCVNGGTIIPFCGLELRHVHIWGRVKTEGVTDIDGQSKNI